MQKTEIKVVKVEAYLCMWVMTHSNTFKMKYVEFSLNSAYSCCSQNKPNNSYHMEYSDILCIQFPFILFLNHINADKLSINFSFWNRQNKHISSHNRKMSFISNFDLTLYSTNGNYAMHNSGQRNYVYNQYHIQLVFTSDPF